MLVESACSLIEATAGHVAYRFRNKNHVCFWKWVFPLRVLPSPSSRTVQPLWAVINCYCQQHNQVQEQKKILQHLSWAQPQESRTYRNTQKCTTHSRRMGVTIDFCADVRDIAQILRPGYKRCFVFRELWLFCDTRPMTDLCLDFRSVKLWTASSFSPSSATFTFL